MAKFAKVYVRVLELLAYCYAQAVTVLKPGCVLAKWRMEAARWRKAHDNAVAVYETILRKKKAQLDDQTAQIEAMATKLREALAQRDGYQARIQSLLTRLSEVERQFLTMEREAMQLRQRDRADTQVIWRTPN